MGGYRFKGVGPKTVACVMMFCLHREEFPVDTHVWRISKSLGWVPLKASREDTYRHLNIRVPADIRQALFLGLFLSLVAAIAGLHATCKPYTLHITLV